MKRFGSAVLLLVVFGMLATACTLTQNAQYKVTFGQDVEMIIFKQPTNQIVQVFLFCNGNTDNAPQCTLDLLRASTDVKGWGAAQFHQALGETADFADAMAGGSSRSILTSYYGDGGNRDINRLKCLAISWNPLNHQTNWTTKSRTDSNCHIGKPFG